MDFIVLAVLGVVAILALCKKRKTNRHHHPPRERQGADEAFTQVGQIKHLEQRRREDDARQ